MLVSELLTSMRYSLNDPNATAFSDPELVDYVNLALNNIHQTLVRIDSDMVRTMQTITTVSGTAYYALPASYWSTAYVHVDGQTTPLDGPKSPSEFLKYPAAQSPGIPTMFMTDATYIYFRPVPNAVMTIYHFHHAPRALVTTASTMPWSGIFDMVVRQFVQLYALNRDEYSLETETALFTLLEKKALDIAGMRLPEYQELDIYP